MLRRRSFGERVWLLRRAGGSAADRLLARLGVCDADVRRADDPRVSNHGRMPSTAQERGLHQEGRHQARPDHGGGRSLCGADALRDMHGRTSAEANAREAEAAWSARQAALDAAIAAFSGLEDEPAHTAEADPELREARMPRRSESAHLAGRRTVVDHLGGSGLGPPPRLPSGDDSRRHGHPSSVAPAGAVPSASLSSCSASRRRAARVQDSLRCGAGVRRGSPAPASRHGRCLDRGAARSGAHGHPLQGAPWHLCPNPATSSVRLGAGRARLDARRRTRPSACGQRPVRAHREPRADRSADLRASRRARS